MALAGEQQQLYESALLRLLEGGYFPARDVAEQAVLDLQRALELGPDSARVRALLGFYLGELSRWAEAAEQFRRAAQRRPGKKLYDVSYLAALSHADNDLALTELARLAPRYGVDLQALEEERRAHGLDPRDAAALVGQGFYHARNFLLSELTDEALTLLDRRAGVTRAVLRRRELGALRQAQKELAAGFDLSRVPDEIRELAQAVVRLGLGDDGLRPLAFSRIGKKELARLTARAGQLAPVIHRWLDGFPQGTMSDEAAAYMYFLLGLEERR